MSLLLYSPSRYTPDTLVSDLSSEVRSTGFCALPPWLRLHHLSGTAPNPATSSVHSASPLFSNRTLQAQTIFKPCYRREPARAQPRSLCPRATHFTRLEEIRAETQVLVSPTRQRLWWSAYRCLLRSPWPSFSHRGSMINLWWNEWLICRKQFKLIRSGVECRFLS